MRISDWSSDVCSSDLGHRSRSCSISPGRFVLSPPRHRTWPPKTAKPEKRVSFLSRSGSAQTRSEAVDVRAFSSLTKVRTRGPNLLGSLASQPPGPSLCLEGWPRDDGSEEQR